MNFDALLSIVDNYTPHEIKLTLTKVGFEKYPILFVEIITEFGAGTSSSSHYFGKEIRLEELEVRSSSIYLLLRKFRPQRERNYVYSLGREMAKSSRCLSDWQFVLSVYCLVYDAVVLRSKTRNVVCLVSDRS